MNFAALGETRERDIPKVMEGKLIPARVNRIKLNRLLVNVFSHATHHWPSSAESTLTEALAVSTLPYG